ncbi:MAG: hypothetical protein GKR89_03715 [Candidatus Latescibacteria bacterium]|nr:hypothetical protein [Candidatus Latescibacterota bacterium]
MATDLEKLLAFCVEHKLLDTESAKRAACEYDRYWESIVRIVVKCGVDERKLYEIAAGIHHIRLVELDQLTVDPNVLDFVPLEHANQLYCIPYSINTSDLSVVTCHWDRLEVITKGMANLTGKQIHVDLISDSDYSRLNERLTEQ